MKLATAVRRKHGLDFKVERGAESVLDFEDTLKQNSLKC